MTEKPLQLADVSLSEKDIIEEKENSIMNKSFFSTDFNFGDLVERKNYLQVKLDKQEYYLQIHSKSIKKIFFLISDNKEDELEDNYLEYITCLIGEDEQDKQQLFSQNNNQMIQNVLEPSYYELLNKTKIYYIDIPNLYNKKRYKKIILKKNSLEKISSLLDMNIFNMSSYIEIIILTYNENDSLGEKFLFKAKLMGKLNHSKEDINKEKDNFTGIKQFNIDIDVVKKNNRNKLQILDLYFNNIWNTIEKENINDENLSFNGTPFEKNPSEEINNNNNINLLLPSSYNINNINNREMMNKNINKGELNDENSCVKNVCGNICNIF